MEEIFSKLDDISSKIRSIENDRKRVAEFLKNLKEFDLDKDSKIIENNLSKKVVDEQLKKARFIGVDGGLAKRSYHSLDLIMTRAVGAVFDYRNGKLDKVNYMPSPSPTPNLRVIHDASESDFQYIASFERINTEVNNMKKCLDMNPTILLADGSILPHPADQPKKGTRIYSEYNSLIDNYKSLYSKSKGFLFAGVVEDSRSSTFSDYISKKILDKIDSEKAKNLSKLLKNTRDTNLLYHVLNKGERSFIMRMDHNQDMSHFSRKLFLFYLKTTEYDRPVRIEFYASGDPVVTANNIASYIYSVSSQNQEYGIPPVIIEADNRAKIKEGELDMIHSHIVDRVGNLPSIYRLRRDRRPF